MDAAQKADGGVETLKYSPAFYQKRAFPESIESIDFLNKMTRKNSKITAISRKYIAAENI